MLENGGGEHSDEDIRGTRTAISQLFHRYLIK